MQVEWKWNGMEFETSDLVNQWRTVCNKSKQRNDFLFKKKKTNMVAPGCKLGTPILIKLD